LGLAEKILEKIGADEAEISSSTKEPFKASIKFKAKKQKRKKSESQILKEALQKEEQRRFKNRYRSALEKL
jgi:hypothetical protein